MINLDFFPPATLQLGEFPVVAERAAEEKARIEAEEKAVHEAAEKAWREASAAASTLRADAPVFVPLTLAE